MFNIVSHCVYWLFANVKVARNLCTNWDTDLGFHGSMTIQWTLPVCVRVWKWKSVLSRALNGEPVNEKGHLHCLSIKRMKNTLVNSHAIKWIVSVFRFHTVFFFYNWTKNEITKCVNGYNFSSQFRMTEGERENRHFNASRCKGFVWIVR